MNGTLRTGRNMALLGGQVDSRGLPLRFGILGGYDPLGFDAGDDNLYRYVVDDPTNATDPFGLKINRGTFENLLPRYVSDDEKKILEALFGSDLYGQMMEALEESELMFELQIDTKLKSGKYSVPGLTRETQNPKYRGKGERAVIKLNPTFDYPGCPDGEPNPAEIADTILHELMHAVLMDSSPNPLLPGGTDAFHDPRFDVKRLIYFIGDPKLTAKQKEILEKDYGPDPLYPDLVYSDINRALQNLIAEELKKIREQAGVGCPTLTEAGLP